MRKHKDYKDYKDYLSSELWKNKKVEVRNGKTKNVDRKCKICKRVGKTDIHHLSYRRLFKERKKDLMEICRDCHQEIHKLQKNGMQLWGATHHLKAKKKREMIRQKNEAKMKGEKIEKKRN